MNIVSSQKKKRKYLFFISQDYSFPILRPLQKEILSRGDEIKWFLYGNEINYNHLQNNEKRLISVADIINYHPDAVFVPGNVVPSFIPGLKVEVFHGLPGSKRTKKGQIYHYIIRGMFDLYCTQGPSSTTIFKKLATKYNFFHVYETGWCKLDPLFPSTHPPSSKEKSIFFASTFSPRYTKANVLFPFIQTMIKKYEYHWYITLHPKMDQEIVKKYQSITSSKVTFISSVDVIKYFKKSDLMLCDISSIVYEYMTQMKPVVTFQSTENDDSLINTNNFQELEETLVSLLDNIPNHTLQTIQKKVKTYHPYNDGKSSMRVLDCTEEILETNHNCKKKKPINLIRNFKLRKALNYWKF